MADDHKAPQGLFAGTIFEGGIFGSGGHKGHDHAPATEFERIMHETMVGYFVFETLAEWGVSRALSLWIIFIGLLMVLSDEIPHLPSFGLEWFVGTAPLWMPIFFLVSAWYAWIWYVQGLYISGRDPIVLDIKIPREITKSPRAMELVFTSLYNTGGEGSFIHRIIHGQVRVWYSFEYASFGGEVHMFIWCWKSHRHAVETAFYAQFPDIEIQLAEDYASKFRFDPAKHKAFVNEHHYTHTDALPLKTYVEFELDKDPDEEFKIDPIAQIFEFLSALQPGEQIWVQIIFRATGKQGSIFNPNKGKGNGVKNWLSRIDDQIEKIRTEASVNVGKKSAPESDPDKYGFPRPTWVQTEQIRTMERQKGKIPYDVGIRAIYIADTTRSPFTGTTANGTRWFWKAMNNPGYLNELAPARGHNTLEFPWQDFMGLREELMIRRFIDAYRRRSAFFSPWVIPTQVMTTEVLATMFHFPSSSIAVPGLDRIPATKAEPPHNLPK
jgi:hypothetical protein